MQTIFSTPKSIKENSTFTFCPGCDHGVAIKLVAQVIDELNLQQETIAVASSANTEKPIVLSIIVKQSTKARIFLSFT